MKPLSYYRIIQGANLSPTKKETEIRAIKKTLTKDFDNSIDVEEVFVNEDNRRLLITRTSDENIKKVKSKPDESFELGDVIHWLSYDWIVYKLDGDCRINTKGRMRQCNVVLKWINDEGEIICRPGYCEDATKYSAGVENKPQIRLGEFQIKIQLHLDEETCLLQRDRRFLIDAIGFIPVMQKHDICPNAFKLTRRNIITGTYNDKGIVELTLCEDQFSPNSDNAELMIADYYKNRPVFEIKVVNALSPLVLELGNELLLEVLITKNGQSYNGIPIYYSSDESIVSVSSDGIITAHSVGECTIQVTFSESVCKIQIKVCEASASDYYNMIVVSPESNNEIIYGCTGDFKVKIKKNGEQVNEKFEAEIIGEPEIAKIENIVNEVITIHAFNNEENVGKKFVLHVWNTDLGVDTKIDIKVGGLW